MRIVSRWIAVALTGSALWAPAALPAAFAKEKEPAPAPKKDATQVVKDAYQDVLGRAPDAKGLSEFRSHVLDQGWTEEQVRNELRKSDEYLDKQITEAYQDLLGRKPDAAGLALYRKKLKDDWTIEKVRKELKSSPEYKQKHPK
jgi:hypothetical protein